MLILANLLRGIGVVLDSVLGLMIIIVIARAVISWVNPDPFNPIVRFLTSATDPLLRPIRRFVPLVGGGIDLSPILLLLLLVFLRVFLVQTVIDYADSLRLSSMHSSNHYFFLSS